MYFDMYFNEDSSAFQPYQSYAVYPDQFVHVLPWWMRAEAWAQPVPMDRGWFSSAYPNLYPYYPIASVHPDWHDPWSTQPYHSYWWG